MNLPNQLTILRVLLIPVFMVLLMNGYGLWAALVFILASLTDALDGYLARKYELITNFGKIMDPLADKLLVTAALLCLCELGQVASWMVFVILAREFLISGLRAVAASQNIVIAASFWGKLKTVSQMTAVIFLLLENWPFSLWNLPVAQWLLWIAVILTIISGADYIIKSKDVFKG